MVGKRFYIRLSSFEWAWQGLYFNCIDEMNDETRYENCDRIFGVLKWMSNMTAEFETAFTAMFVLAHARFLQNKSSSNKHVDLTMNEMVCQWSEYWSMNAFICQQTFIDERTTLIGQCSSLANERAQGGRIPSWGFWCFMLMLINQPYDSYGILWLYDQSFSSPQSRAIILKGEKANRPTFRAQLAAPYARAVVRGPNKYLLRLRRGHSPPITAYTRLSNRTEWRQESINIDRDM